MNEKMQIERDMTIEQQAGQLMIKLANCIDGPQKHAVIAQAITGAVAEATIQWRQESVVTMFHKIQDAVAEEREQIAKLANLWGHNELAAAIRKEVKP